LRTRSILAQFFLFALGTATLLAEAPTPNENPQGDTGALKEQITTGGSYNGHSGSGSRIVRDLEMPGALGGGLDFTRYWNSVHPEDTDQAAVWSMDFGYSGWSHSWKWSAVYDYDEPDHETHPPPYVYVSSITITFPDGHATKFKISRGDADGRCGPPYYASHGERDWPSPGPEVHDHLAEMAQDGSEFWLYRADGGMVRFVGLPGLQEYQAREVYDPHGFRTDLLYNGELLTRVQQEGGRYLNIVWGVLPGDMPVITRVETGGLAGSQQVTYKYSKPGGDYVLTKVTYPDTPAPGQTSSAIYTYGYSYQGDQPGVGPQSPFPLLKYADDPNYTGAMTKIRYDYRGETCPTQVLPTPPPNTDSHRFTAEAIKQERSGETGEVVSAFEGGCALGERKESNGLGGERRLYYGSSGHDSVLPLGLSSYQLTKVTNFGPPGGDPSALPAGRQTGSQPPKVWDGLLHRTDLTYDNSGGVAQILHTVDGSSAFYDRVNSGTSAPPDATRIRNPYHHWLFSKRDELNNVITYKRDARRRVTQIDYPGWSYEEYSYNEFNQVLTHRLPSGAVQTYQYNALHQLELEYNSVEGFNERKEYFYDSLGRVERTRDARAIRDNAPYTERMEYNGRHQVIKVHYRPTGGNSDPTVTTEYDKYGNRTAVIDELGHRKDYTYDAYRRCTSLTEQTGSNAGCNNNQVRRTDWIYDRVIEGDTQSTRLASTHTSKEWRIQIEPEFNDAHHRRATSRTFDRNNRMLSEQTGLIQLPGDPLGILQPPGPEAETHSVTYDANGQKSSSTDPLGRVTTYDYDDRNRLWKTNETVNTSMPRTTETLYDVAGNKTLVKFPDLKTQSWADYDAFGQPGRSIDERNNTTHLYYRWGPMKELASVVTHRAKDGGGTEDQPTQFWQDALGRPTQTVFPDGTTEETTYELGQLKTYKTRRGQTRVIDVYDERGREQHHYWLTPQNAVDLQTPAISQIWDDAGRLKKIWNSFSLIEYAYDEAGGVQTEGTTVTGTGLSVVGYCRYPNGEVSQITYPNGTTVTRSYTARGQLKDVGWQAGATSYVYWPDGKVNVQVRTNHVSTIYGYNERGMISSVEHRNDVSGRDLAKRTYWRDDRDRIVAWKRGTDNFYNGMEDGRGNRYGYDEEGQLTGASYRALNPETATPTGAMRTDSFSYDALGNRQGQNHVANRGQWMAMGRRDNGLNQYINWSNDPEHPVPDPLHWGSAIYHDDNMPMSSPTPTPPVRGNGVTTADGYITASYNALNQPVGMWSQVYSGTPNYLWFGYDPLGRCVKRWKGPASAGTPGYNPATYFYYDGSDMVQEGPSAASADRVYVHGGRVDEIVASQVSGVWYNHHYDAQGNCILLSTSNDGGLQEQYDYDAFGYPYFYTPSGGKGGNVKTRFLFTGREWISDMKVYDYRARMYQPELGRFLQPDPQEFAAGDYNLYRYCHNDPVNKSDPTGLREPSVGETHRDIMWDLARYMDGSNNEQGSFSAFTHGAYTGGNGGGGGSKSVSLRITSEIRRPDPQLGMKSDHTVTVSEDGTWSESTKTGVTTVAGFKIPGIFFHSASVTALNGSSSVFEVTMKGYAASTPLLAGPAALYPPAIFPAAALLGIHYDFHAVVNFSTHKAGFSGSHSSYPSFMGDISGRRVFDRRQSRPPLVGLLPGMEVLDRGQASF